MLDRPILGFYKQRLIFAYKSLRLVWPTLHCALLASSTDVLSSKAFYLLLDGSPGQFESSRFARGCNSIKSIVQFACF